MLPPILMVRMAHDHGWATQTDPAPLATFAQPVGWFRLPPPDPRGALLQQRNRSCVVLLCGAIDGSAGERGCWVRRDAAPPQRPAQNGQEEHSMSAYPEDRSAEPATAPLGPGGPALDASGPGTSGASDPGAPPRPILPAPVLQALGDGDAVVVPEGQSGAVTIRMSGLPLLRLDPGRRPAAAWCSPAFGDALAGLFAVERWTRALAAHRDADLVLHQGLRAELEVASFLRRLARGGFRADAGGGIRVTEYHVSHPAVGSVATLSVARGTLHVADIAWSSPRLMRALRTMVAIEAQARRR
jgi:hypothetical protein